MLLTDAGSGVDPASIRIAIDGRTRAVPALSKGLLAVQTGGLAAGRHTLRIQVSDYQETRNMENVGGVLPNTRVATATIVVR